jgi:uncharacterized protein
VIAARRDWALVSGAFAAVLSAMTSTAISSAQHPQAPAWVDPKAVVERYLAAVQAGDERAVRELLAPAATWHLRGDLPFAGFWQGRDAILGEFLTTALGYYEPDSMHLEPTGVVVEGDRVVLEWVSRARTRAGEPYENFCIAVFTVREGRIQAVREYMDTLYAHRVAFSAPEPSGVRPREA